MSDARVAAGAGNDARGGEGSAGGDVETTPPISFLRWAGPVMAVWVPVCVFYFVDGPDLGERAFGAAFFLFPVYLCVYVGRLNFQMINQPLWSRIVVAFLLVLICIPSLYILPDLLVHFSVVIGLPFVGLGVLGLDSRVFGGVHLGGVVGSATRRHGGRCNQWGGSLPLGKTHSWL